jgi:hypothetical protein
MGLQRDSLALTQSTIATIPRKGCAFSEAFIEQLTFVQSDSVMNALFERLMRSLES